MNWFGEPFTCANCGRPDSGDMAYNRALQKICLECTGAEHAKDRRIAESTVGDYWVSTVFLVNNHNFTGQGPPLLWETMVFDSGGSATGYAQRYSGEAAALAGHDQMVALVRELFEVPQSPPT